MDHKGRFIITNVGHAGKVHDTRVLRTLRLYLKEEKVTLFPRNDGVLYGVSMPKFILGDPAYLLLPWLMKSYPYINDLPE